MNLDIYFCDSADRCVHSDVCFRSFTPAIRNLAEANHHPVVVKTYQPAGCREYKRGVQ